GPDAPRMPHVGRADENAAIQKNFQRTHAHPIVADTSRAVRHFAVTGIGHRIKVRYRFVKRFAEAVTNLNAMTNSGHGKVPYGPTGVGDDWVRMGPLKVFLDGGILVGTAYMRHPWGIGP